MADEEIRPEETELVDIGEVSQNLPVSVEEEEQARREAGAVNLSRHSRIAHLHERFAAFFIDSAVLFYLYWVLGTLARRAFYQSWDGPIPSYGWQGLAFNGAFVVAIFLYYFVFEGAFLTTPGKFCCWMYVRRKDFSHPSLSSIFLRNFFRFFDYLLPFLPIFCMELTRTRGRLGDHIAGTTVIKKYGSSSGHYAIKPGDIASASGRLISSLIDLAIVGTLLAGYALLLSPNAPTLSKWMLLLSPLVPILYFVITEPLTHTTPGKWILGHTITHDDGEVVSFAGSLIRNLMRIIDFNPFGLLVMWLSQNKQRPGDLAAGTLVTRQKRRWPGAVALVVWPLVAGAVFRFGWQNSSNFLHEDFKFNFIPAMEIMGGFAEESAYKEPMLTHFRFAVDDKGTIRTPPVFRPGETVYIIFDLYGYQRSGRMVWIQEDLDLRYPDGSIGLHQENAIDFHQVIETKGGPIELSNNINLPPTAVAGTYTLTITVRDLFAHERITAQQTIEVQNM